MQQQKITAYTASEAARVLGVSPTTIYDWLKDGTLTEPQFSISGRTRLVSAESVERLKRERNEVPA